MITQDPLGFYWTERTECPNCRTTKTHWHLYKAIEEHGWPDDIPRMIVYYMCRCGLVISHKYPTMDDMEEFYDHYTSSVATARGEEVVAKDELERAVRVVENLPYTSVMKHLDVGCARGHLINEMREKYNCESHGVDLRKFDTVPHWTKYLEDVYETYDLVTCIHTLEHHPFPIEFLRDMRRVSGKHLFIEVPSLGMDNLERSPHPVLFNVNTLPVVVEKAGFVIDMVRQIKHGGKLELQCSARAV